VGRSVASDTVVARAIYKLRQVLREFAGTDKAVVTVRGVGYRFDARIDPPPDAEQVRKNPSRWLPGLVVGFAGLILLLSLVGAQLWRGSAAAQPRIALMPLDNATGDRGLDWTRRGITELMTERLRRQGVEVISEDRWPESSRPNNQANHDLSELLQATGVSSVLQPRLQPSADGYRLQLSHLAGDAVDNLELTGSDAANLSGALADLLAAKLNAPNRLPAGAQDLDNPFLQEAYARAFDHFHRSEHDNARQLYHYILNQSPDNPWALYRLGILMRHSGDMEQARAHLAHLQSLEPEDPWLQASIQSQLGTMAWYAGDLDQAEQHYQAGQAIFDDHGFDDGTASMLANLGMIANSRAQFERGHRLQFEAMQIYQRQGNRPAQATVLHNIGLARFQAGELDRARSALQQALRIRDALALTDATANTRSVLADIAVRKGRLDEAGLLYERIHASYQATGNRRGRDQALNDLASIALMQGLLDQAHERAVESITGARERSEPAAIAVASLTLGRVLHAKGDLGGAERHYGEALDIWRDYDNPRAQLSCLAEQTRLELDRHDASQARQRLSEFKHIADTAGVSSFKPIGEALELRLRMTDEEVLDPAFGNEIEALFGDLDPDSLRIAELAAELGQGLFDQESNHPTLPYLKDIASAWAPRYFPAARLLYISAQSRQECDRAMRALRQLRGERWQDDLPRIEHCLPPPS